MAAIFTALNQKGGVAKTTTVTNLGYGLAQKGYHVLIIDLDAQGNVADALGIRKGNGLQRFLIGGMGQAAVTENVRPNLDVITSDKTAVEVKQTLTGMSFREYKLRDALSADASSPLDQKYDIVILDVAPGVDVLQIGALVACTHFLIPVNLAHLAVIGIIDALGTVASLKKVGAFNGMFLGVLPTMYDRQTNESQMQLEQMANQFHQLVWSPIPTDTVVRSAQREGKTLWEYAPNCRALTGVQVGNCMIGGYEKALQRLIKEVLHG